MRVLHRGKQSHFRTVDFDRRDNVISLIEQRTLPHKFEIKKLRTTAQTVLAIRDMMVRGAGAIGATAGYGLAQACLAFQGTRGKPFTTHINKAQKAILDARPTAVDPANALRYVRAAIDNANAIEEAKANAVKAAQIFAEANVEDCRKIGLSGRSLIKPGTRILTHCNAGWLAFVDIGSATAPIYAAHADGIPFHVYCDETRPRLQGASLTAWELHNEGVSHDIIPDNAAGHMMQRGEIDLVITGADRVLGKTGAAANKIGTYTKAVLAKHHKIPFYIAIPLSTLDWSTSDGFEIPIEERDEIEVTQVRGVTAAKRWHQVSIANPGSTARNPAFDVTPPELITGIITPKGIYRPSQLKKKKASLQNPFNF